MCNGLAAVDDTEVGQVAEAVPVACAANSLSTFGQRGKVDIKLFLLMLLFLKTFLSTILRPAPTSWAR